MRRSPNSSVIHHSQNSVGITGDHTDPRDRLASCPSTVLLDFKFRSTDVRPRRNSQQVDFTCPFTCTFIGFARKPQRRWFSAALPVRCRHRCANAREQVQINDDDQDPPSKEACGLASRETRQRGRCSANARCNDRGSLGPLRAGRA